MAVLATQKISRAGLVATYAAVSGGGDKFKPSDKTFLHVKNGNGSACVVTVVTPGTVDGENIADRAVSVAAGAHALIGPFPPDLFRDSDDGYADVTWGVTSSVTAAVVSL